MSTSGTVGTTVFEVDDVINHAMYLAGLPASRLTPENVKIIKQSLYLGLLELQNRGWSLWTIEFVLLGLYPGEVDVLLPVGTIDVTNYSYRNTQRVLATSVTSDLGGTVANLSDGDVETICTQSGPNGDITFVLGSGGPRINVLGLLPGASGDWSFTVDQSIDGITWVPTKTVSGLAVEDGRWIWYQLEPSILTPYMRIKATDGTTLSFREVYLCQTYYDVPMARLNRDDYSSFPYKQFPSQQTLQFWLDRRYDRPKMVLWPSPSTTFACLWVSLYKEVQDVGTLTNSLAVPGRALPGIINQLALDIILKIPGADKTRLPTLEKAASSSVSISRAEERDLGPTFIGPDISPYTR